MSAILCAERDHGYHGVIGTCSNPHWRQPRQWLDKDADKGGRCPACRQRRPAKRKQSPGATLCGWLRPARIRAREVLRPVCGEALPGECQPAEPSLSRPEKGDGGTMTEQNDLDVIIMGLEALRTGATVHTVNKAISYLRSLEKSTWWMKDDAERVKIFGIHLANCQKAVASGNLDFLEFSMRRWF